MNTLTPSWLQQQSGGGISNNPIPPILALALAGATIAFLFMARKDW
jgi:hypothetical protein